jgi:hypothetical protein
MWMDVRSGEHRRGVRSAAFAKVACRATLPSLGWSLVSRPAGSFDEDVSPYIDFREFAGVVPPQANAAATLALRNLLDRLNSGDRPPAGTPTSNAIAQVNTGMSSLSER